MKIVIVLLISFVILLAASFPIIWSLNALFHLNIPVSFETISATFYLLVVAKSEGIKI